MQFVFAGEAAIKILVPGTHMQVYPQAMSVRHNPSNDQGGTKGPRIRNWEDIQGPTPASQSHIAERGEKALLFRAHDSEQI